MNEISIQCVKDDSKPENKNIKISVVDETEEELLYKFIVGTDRTWNTLKDFSSEKSAQWDNPKDGKYTIMVQAKKMGSNKAFDYVSKLEYIIGDFKEKIIQSLNLNKDKFNIGEKVKLTVQTTKFPLMFKYWIEENGNWKLIKDYTADNTLTYTLKISGEHKIKVECKDLELQNDSIDCSEISFNVFKYKKLQITELKTLTTDLILHNDIIFEVKTEYEDNRMILYKFIKINKNGNATCLQDYSNKRLLNYVETEQGEYRLLCLAKDMYSPEEYDDRALLYYTVKKYNPIEIISFTSDLSSPQTCGTSIELKAIVEGGKDILYRFIIDGNQGEDSGYIRENSYKWIPKKHGKYKIDLWVKDSSFEGSYEAKKTFEFNIEDIVKEPITINNVILDKQPKLVKGETVNIAVSASGGIELKYAFIVLKDKKEKEKVNYGSCSWVNFTPEESGEYDVEIRVKDKYSSREYDGHSFIHLDVADFLLAQIDYVLLHPKEYYLINEKIDLQIITLNTKNILVKYVLKIEGHKVEETDFVQSKLYAFTPKIKGNYTVEVYARNIKSNEEFDCKKEVNIFVDEAMPVTDTNVSSDKTNICVNEAVTFNASCNGGKDVVYEFYLMEKGDWKLVQRYSKKNYYAFMPFSKGEYKLLVLVKSNYKRCAYEDYYTLDFNVERE